jgi:large subunit ribosomal protein L4
MNVKVYNQEGKEVGQADLPAEIFDVKMNKNLVHQAMVTQMANSRQVLAHTKDRSEVRGGGRKPWRQKGTGRARHGSIRSPIWRGGGVTFGPTKERVFAKKINKKMKRQALLMILSSKVKDKEMILLDKLEIAEAKTKKIMEVINNLKTKLKKNLEKGTLIVLPAADQKIIRASKNIPKIKTIRADSLNVLDILSSRYLLMPQGAIEIIKQTYLK